ncbi:diguanylate cyclase [Catenulispora yoronensis]
MSADRRPFSSPYEDDSSEPAAPATPSAGADPAPAEASAPPTDRSATSPGSPDSPNAPNSTDPGSPRASAPTPNRPRSWPRRRPRPPDPSVTVLWERSEQENRRFATRFAGQLLLIGAGLGVVLTLFLGVQQGAFSLSWWGFMGACALAGTWGLVYILLPGPAPDPVLQATPAASALLITATMALNHSNAADGMLLLTWPVLFAAYLLPRRTAYWTLAIVIGCLTVVLGQGTGPGRFAAWVEVTASVALTLVVILQVRAQADRLKEVLAEQARTDPLTGLGNRRAFDEAFEREIARQRRTRTPLSLLAVDVDHFKRVNDTWGHAAGDEALSALGDLLPGWSAPATSSAGSAARSSPS